ncbi:hypothetical protein HDE_00123 [Halotydeus destructor]|nr:hypothetical protein HDE_00123 [Halotydeus destructor]
MKLRSYLSALSLVLISEIQIASSGTYFVDLTYPLNEEVIHWIEAIDFQHDVLFNGTRSFGTQKTWFQDDNIKLSVHTGTHMDAPCHFGKPPAHPCISEIPFESLLNKPGIIIDVTDKVNQNRNYQVTVDDITDFEAEYGQIPDGSIVFLQTGMGRFWPDRELYLGTTSKDPNMVVYPSLHQSAARWLVDNRPITGIAIESVSPDNMAVTGGTNPVHKIILSQNYYIIENVPYKIKDIPRTGCRFTALPMKLEDCSGAPVRLIAECPC